MQNERERGYWCRPREGRAVQCRTMNLDYHHHHVDPSRSRICRRCPMIARSGFRKSTWPNCTRSLSRSLALCLSFFLSLSLSSSCLSSVCGDEPYPIPSYPPSPSFTHSFIHSSLHAKTKGNDGDEVDGRLRQCVPPHLTHARAHFMTANLQQKNARTVLSGWK